MRFPRLLLGALVLAAVGLPAAAPAHPSCFGAAARDPRSSCAHPELRLGVVPRPRDAPLEPGSPCRLVRAVDLVAPCAFGTYRTAARGAVALIGDSHAAHWRPAVFVLAHRLHLRAYMITRDSCPFSTAGRPDDPYAADCTHWKAEVPAWLAAHPWIHTVFVAQLTRDIAAAPFSAQVASYEAAWQQLPASVSRIVVIRDNPEARFDTLACVSRAMARRTPPGPACALPRPTALAPDPAAAAARQVGRPRLHTVDFSRFFCSRHRCFPVVGGVLVYKDENHLTPLFARTLGPYLLRAVRRFLR